MRIKRVGLQGCCVSSHFYDLGGAHGHPRAKDFEEFAEKIVELGYAAVNTAITNPYQTEERKYLDQLGFKVASKSKNGVWVHSASSADLEEALAPVRKQLIEAKRKREEEKKRLAAERMAREREERERLRQINLANPPVIKGYESRTRCSSNDLYMLKRRFPDHDIKTIARQAFNVDLPDTFNVKGNLRSYTDSWGYRTQATRIAEAINRRIKKRLEASVPA
jgi:hypothetical protein